MAQIVVLKLNCCMHVYIFWSYEVVVHNSLHACPCFESRPWFHLDFVRISSLEQVLEALNWLNSCMFACSSYSWNLVSIWVQLIFFWVFDFTFELLIMLNFEFWNVFWKIGPNSMVLMHLRLNLSLRFKSGNSRFWTHARTGWLALERGNRAPSILFYFWVSSSGVINA